MQHAMILQRGWPLIEKTSHWSFGYLVCLIPVMVVRSAMKVGTIWDEKKRKTQKK